MLPARIAGLDCRLGLLAWSAGLDCMFKLEVPWIAGLDCMHGQKPLNGALGCRSVGLKVCIPSIAGLKCMLGVQKCAECLGYAVLQIRLVMEETWTSG